MSINFANPINIFQIPNLWAPLKLVFMGSSIVARAYSGLSPNFVETSVGFATWIKVLTNQRFYSPPSYNLGVNGRNTANTLLDMPAALALNPSAIVSDGGITNDVANNVAYATTIANLTAMFNLAYAAGIPFVITLMFGRSGGNALTATQIKTGTNVNRWLRQQQYIRKNFFVADCGLTFDDPAAAAWQDRSGYTDDGLHSNNLGAPTIAQPVANILNALFPFDWVNTVTNASDLYDATDAPYGNLCTNGMMLGTAGTAGGLGSVADNWVCTSSALGGATCALSKSSFADGSVAQQADLSGTYTGNGKLLQFSRTMTAANFASGDVVDYMARVSVTSPVKIVDVGITLQSTESGTTYRHKCLYSGTVEKTTGYSGVLKVPPRTLLAAPASIIALVEVIFVTPQAGTPAIGGTIKFGNVGVFKNLPTPN